jgi:very-short-patch-repair endonuclease
MTALCALAAFAARQHHLITTAQLRSLGFSPAAIRHLVAGERIFRVYRGVYAVGRKQLTEEGRWMAAVLACPPGAALSHVSAAVLWELLRQDSPRPHVIVPAGRSNRGPRAIVVHHSTTFTERDVTRRGAIPVTTVLRTLSDLSLGGLPDSPLNGAVRQAGRLHHADLQRLEGRPRLGRIVRLYDPLVGMTDSDMEVLFLALCATHRLPEPLPQEPFGPYRADFTWHEYRLVVESDSRGWHDNDVNFLSDRRKDRAIRAAGYEVLRFTYAEIVHQPATVAREIRAALRRQAQKVSLRRR